MVSTMQAQYWARSLSTVLMTSSTASASSPLPTKRSPSPTQRSRAPSLCAGSSLPRIIRTCRRVCTASSSAVPAWIRPRESPAAPTTSELWVSSVMIGTKSSVTAGLGLPAYASPSPMIDAILVARIPGDISPSSKVMCSARRARAGSQSDCVPAQVMPTASRAPARMFMSLLYRYLSTIGRPPSTSHSEISPMLAVALIFPWSLFLKIRLLLLTFSPASSSGSHTSLSLQKPALTKPLTKAFARCCLAVSIAPAPLDSTRCCLNTSSGVLASTTSRSLATPMK
mmetsp:Transcript_3156/g.9520  ORF Transcript_3156/g.9520 Transcript_3156/m.9520 type:complete len:284 (-) Transcript_3156:1425-2276(-)